MKLITFQFYMVLLFFSRHTDLENSLGVQLFLAGVYRCYRVPTSPQKQKGGRVNESQKPGPSTGIVNVIEVPLNGGP